MKTEEMICELRRLEEAHKNDFVGTCETNWSLMCRDVANRMEELLVAQEPRVMTLEEVEDALDTVVWVDRPGMENMSDAYALISGYSRMNKELWLRYVFIKKPRTKVEAYGDYGIVYRCWTSRPTDEQKEAIPWK